MQCLECKAEFESESSLHKHLKAHDLRIAEYYQKFHTRLDKFDGSLIKFKNKEQYFGTFFNSRENLRKWLEKTPVEEAKKFCIDLLTDRKNKKNLIWTPSQVELRSLLIPPIQYFNKLFGNYYKLCEDLGFRNRFDKMVKFEIPFFTPNYVIYQDSREQLPLTFPTKKSELKGLKIGDYAASNQGIENRCYIERKSGNDAIATLSGGYDRFCRELDRAVEAKAYVVVIVEETLNSCLKFDKLPQFYHKNVRINPEYVFHNVREIIQKYPNVQFLFVDGRERAAFIIENIFDSNDLYKELDLQLAYDLGEL